MTENKEPFDPSDPFEGTVDDLLVTISLAFAAFIGGHSVYRTLEGKKQVEAVIIGGSVALMSAITALVADETKPHLVQIVGDYLPHALEMAQEIRLHGEIHAAGGVQ